ncbi:MAG: APC family permease [Segniliparus sp.]|uniref:APC family permease n=1 Tax=Segniliparus sp. TaxID=2804064 RepID=UPI003F3BECA3
MTTLRDAPPPAEAQPLSPSGSSPAQLKGQLGVWSVVFMVAAAASPLGVVGGPTPLGIARGNGVGFPAAFLVAGAVLLLFAVGFTAMTPYVRVAGAFSAYIAEGLGRRAGTGAGFAALLSYLTLLAGVYGLLGSGLDALLVSYGAPSLPWHGHAAAALVLVGLLGYRTIDLSGRVLAVGLVAEVLIVAVLDAAVVVSGGKGLSAGLFDPREVFSGSPGIGLLFALLSFIGFEATAVFRSETRDPERTIPRATYVALVLVGAFYAVASWALISAFGDAGALEEAQSRGGDMLADATTAYLGAVGGHIVQILFVTSLFACVLSLHNVAARYVFALSGQGALHVSLAAAHERHNSPHRASVAVSLAVAAALAAAGASGVDAVDQYYTWLAGFSSVGVVLLYAATSLAALVYFARSPKPGLHWWKTTAAPALAFLSLLALLVPILENLPALVGGNRLLAVLIVASILAVFALGAVLAGRQSATTAPELAHQAFDPEGRKTNPWSP